MSALAGASALPGEAMAVSRGAASLGLANGCPRCTGCFCMPTNSAALWDLTALPASLQELYLSGNQLSGVVDLTALPASLQGLYLSGNQLSGRTQRRPSDAYTVYLLDPLPFPVSLLPGVPFGGGPGRYLRSALGWGAVMILGAAVCAFVGSRNARIPQPAAERRGRARRGAARGGDDVALCAHLCVDEPWRASASVPAS